MKIKKVDSFMLKGKDILIVEDEQDIRELIRYHLLRNGCSPREAVTGEEAMVCIQEKIPDLILLDLMLPGIEGLEICRQLKSNAKTSHIPIIIVSAKGEEADVVVGLELGADDYVIKPFSPRVLLARIRSVIRRWEKGSQLNKNEDEIIVGPLHIYPSRYKAVLNQESITMTPSEFSILTLLASTPGKVFTRKQIIDVIRGKGYAVSERTIDVHVLNLRKKLGEFGNRIETIRGIGYCLLDETT